MKIKNLFKCVFVFFCISSLLLACDDATSAKDSDSISNLVIDSSSEEFMYSSSTEFVNVSSMSLMSSSSFFEEQVKEASSSSFMDLSSSDIELVSSSSSDETISKDESSSSDVGFVSSSSVDEVIPKDESSSSDVGFVSSSSVDEVIPKDESSSSIFETPASSSYDEISSSSSKEEMSSSSVEIKPYNHLCKQKVDEDNLTLARIKQELDNCEIPRDSLEFHATTTISGPYIGNVSTTVDYYQLGPDKIYFEEYIPFVGRTRYTINGNRIKKNNGQPTEYNGEKLEDIETTYTNPLDTGEWMEPEKVAEHIYTIEGDSVTVYYNASINQIEKLEKWSSSGSVEVQFVYGEDYLLKRQEGVTKTSGINFKITSVFRMRNSGDNPKSLFEF